MRLKPPLQRLTAGQAPQHWASSSVFFRNSSSTTLGNTPKASPQLAPLKTRVLNEFTPMETLLSSRPLMLDWDEDFLKELNTAADSFHNFLSQEFEAQLEQKVSLEEAAIFSPVINLLIQKYLQLPRPQCNASHYYDHAYPIIRTLTLLGAFPDEAEALSYLLKDFCQSQNSRTAASYLLENTRTLWN